MICDLCCDTGMAKECNECRFNPQEDCSTCDGCGFVDCPNLDKEWHK